MRNVFVLAVGILVSVNAAGQTTAGGGPGGALAAPAPRGAGVDEAVVSVPNVFGISDQDIATVGWSEFLPEVSATYSSFTNVGTGGYRWTTAGSQFMTATLPSGIPNGAQITQVAWYAFDSSAADNFTGFLVRYWRESNLGGSPSGDILGSASTAGTPGDTAFALPVPLHTVLRRGDADGVPATTEVVNYVLYAHTPPLDGTVRVGQVRVLWRRQVSPPPAVATFGDVLPGNPQFPFVEALVDANITAGCGGGNYCPNDPVTRGQMAVFIAAALGLHFPAF
jgi:hypothetical protein